MLESEIQQRIRIVLNKPGAPTRVWRNNVGKRKIEGRWLVWGLAPGSADLVGIERVIITPEMIGTTIGQFLAVEVKTPEGRLSDEQKAWLASVRNFGGKAVVFRSDEDARDFLKRSGDHG